MEPIVRTITTYNPDGSVAEVRNITIEQDRERREAIEQYRAAVVAVRQSSLPAVFKDYERAVTRVFRVLNAEITENGS